MWIDLPSAKTTRLRCDCGGLLDVQLDMDGAPSPAALAATFESRLPSRLPEDLSGVWRYRELVLDVSPDDLVTFPEGRTNLYTLDPAPLGLSALWAKHEGENPTGSFKDRGMTVAVSWARHQGARALICASTGNTSASLAAYGARAHIPVFVLIPRARSHRASWHRRLRTVLTPCRSTAASTTPCTQWNRWPRQHNLTLVNSLNPFRLEGQKTIILDSYFQLGQMLPDWIVVPGGNLGNTSAFGKALIEMKALGLIDRVPRLAVIQAEGASPFARAARDRLPALRTHAAGDYRDRHPYRQPGQLRQGRARHPLHKRCRHDCHRRRDPAGEARSRPAGHRV